MQLTNSNGFIHLEALQKQGELSLSLKITHIPLTLVTLSVAITVMLGISMGSSAQQSPPAQQNPPVTIASDEVSDGELKNFVKAFTEVQDLRVDLQEKMASVSDQASAQQMQRESTAKMAEAVRANDMEVERFNLLARSISRDETLSARFQETLKGIQNQSGDGK